jgi:hypothetical protein
MVFPMGRHTLILSLFQWIWFVVKTRDTQAIASRGRTSDETFSVSARSPLCPVAIF